MRALYSSHPCEVLLELVGLPDVAFIPQFLIRMGIVLSNGVGRQTGYGVDCIAFGKDSRAWQKRK